MIYDDQIHSNVRLDSYLGSIAKRLQMDFTLRGLGGLGLTALLLTCLCVYIANRFAFSTTSIVSSQVFLFLFLAAEIALLIVYPLWRLRKKRRLSQAAEEAERTSAVFDGRLRTWVDETLRSESRSEAPSPLFGLLSRDAGQAAAQVPLTAVVNPGRIFAFALAGCFGFLTLLWLGTSGPGYWQYGTARIWTGPFLNQPEPLYELIVEPGDITLRHGGNFEVTAMATGFDPGSMQIYAKYESSVDWEIAPMGPQLEGSGYEFTFSLVREPLRYYVVAGRIQTREFQVDVVVMPTVENIRLEYTYPSWSGLESRVEDPGSDILAVEGTKVAVILTTDKQLEKGLLVVGGESIAVQNNRAQIEVTQDSTYHLAVIYQGEQVRLMDDYFITMIPDAKPQVKILEPGRDWRASNIEEVPIRIETSDDFGLRSFELHYAVNGIEQDIVQFPVRRGAKSFAGSHMFYLEELGEPLEVLPTLQGSQVDNLPPAAQEASLLPGDLVSYYLVSSDAKREVRSDMYFINVQPFERRYSQSQQAPGQGGSQGQQDEISRRQKEIILAIWNLSKERDAEDGRSKEKLQESSEMLSELQTALMNQATTLVQRTRARQLTDKNPKFEQFAKFMEQAAEYMYPTAEQLQDFRLDDAVAPAQQSLQYLLRAESIFTDIQISMGQNGQGGGGASRDLAEMFELEMDLEKNQYETGGGASGQQIEQEIDEAMKKLQELARRQEQLADRTQNNEQASIQQRWQQEMLRRDAEDLKRQLEQLQRRQSASQQQSASQGSNGQQSGSSGQQQLQQAIQKLEQASREMEQGSSSGGNPKASTARAQQQLQEALDSLLDQQREQSQSSLANMSQEASSIVDEQHEVAAEIQKSLRVALEALKAQGGRNNGQLPSGMTREEEIDLANRKQEIGERLSEIEREMQRQTRRLRELNDEAAKTVMDALVELQQSEVAHAIQYASEAIRRGYAPYIASDEESVSRALRKLRDQLRTAEQLAQQDDGSRQGQGLAQLLSDVENLRKRMQEASGQSAQEGQQRGQQSGEGGQASQSGGGQQSQSNSGGGGFRAGGSRRGVNGLGGPSEGGFWGQRRLSLPSNSPGARQRMEQALESGAAEVPRLAERLRSGGEFDLRDIAELRNFALGLYQGRFRENPELLDLEYRKMLTMLEQLEVQLRRQLELDDKEEVRAIVSQPVPEHYREAVAEYYRRLSGPQ